MDSLKRSENEVWEGMEGGVVCCGVDEKKTREGCAFLMCTRVWEGIKVYGYKGSRTV